MKHLFIKLFMLFVFFSFSFFLSAREKGKIGISYSLDGGASVVPMKSLIGTGSSEITGFNSFGFVYLKPLNNWLEVETGVNYSYYKIINHPAPMLSVTSTTSSLSIIDVPVGVRANFLKYFFANGGLMFDMDMNAGGGARNQTGVGAMLGVGLKYDFNFGGSIFFNQNIKWHSLIPLTFDSYHECVIEGGWRIGITYKL